MSWALVDGERVPLEDAVVPVTDVGFRAGWTVFETLRVHDGRVPLLEEHLARLAGSASAALIAMPTQLASEAKELAAGVEGEARIRITLSGSGLRVLTVEPVPPTRRGAPVRCVTGPFVVDPFLSGAVKHGSRAAWMVAVRRSGVDDVLMVDDEGRFAEGTTCGIVAVSDGVLRTAPHDGRILASTTVTKVVEVAGALGIPVEHVGARAAGGFDALYCASATRGLAPVVELDGETLAGWDPIGRRVFDAL